MNMTIITGMAVVLLLFIWTWIAIVIINRISLEKEIEKLENITNPLPEEERKMRNLKDLRTIEQGKVGSAKWVVGFFMFLIVGFMGLALGWGPIREFFSPETLRLFTTGSIVLFTFFCIPIMAGLSLAGPKKKDKKNTPRETIEKAEGAA